MLKWLNFRSRPSEIILWKAGNDKDKARTLLKEGLTYVEGYLSMPGLPGNIIDQLQEYHKEVREFIAKE